MLILDVLKSGEIAFEGIQQQNSLPFSEKEAHQLHFMIFASSPFFIGVKGQVTDKNGNPIPNAIVEAKGRPHVCPYRTNQQGEYFLLLLPGTYVINVSMQPYWSIVSNCIEVLSTMSLRGGWAEQLKS